MADNYPWSMKWNLGLALNCSALCVGRSYRCRYASTASIAYRLAALLSSVSENHQQSTATTDFATTWQFRSTTFWPLHVLQAFLGRPEPANMRLSLLLTGFSIVEDGDFASCLQ